MAKYSGNSSNFTNCPDKVNFYQEEQKIFKYWDDINVFALLQERTKNGKPYYFFDGPPFATGTPHYGHILAGTIKDVVLRYFTMQGRYIERKFGWDCHGLPVEYQIDKSLGINSRKQVLDMGIDKYNAECRKIVQTYVKEWRYTVFRFGRWIDFDNGYQTMDLNFMESIWAVFKVIFDKGYVRSGCRVMPYSNACNTVLSNFETQQNYKEVEDPSIYVIFPLLSRPQVSLLVWTTTPWSLPTNIGVAIRKDLEYAEYQDLKSKQIFICLKKLLDNVYRNQYRVQGDLKDHYQILATYKGEKLLGEKYEPIYNFYSHRANENWFKVVHGDFVTDDVGTGMVQLAPAFGQEDFDVCLHEQMIRQDNPPCPLDANGRFNDEIKYEFNFPDEKDHTIIKKTMLSGLLFKEADRYLRKDMRQKLHQLQIDNQFQHNYPHCWRSDTPLIYKAVKCWFIKVSDQNIKQNLLANNMKSKWVPTHAQEQRFNNWLENAQDWCISRNRFWGNPIPLWVSQDGEEVVCVGSIKELKELTGCTREITDLHREFIDDLTIPSQMGQGVLRRIDEVFDCWFQSGSMPFGQVHWPFSMNDDQFMKRFPADFIGEGLDQTRGWFYTLNVIATILQNDTPYQNLIVNGIALAADGKKMSKRLKNYPEPLDVAKETCADAVRLYLVNSPLVKAEPMRFCREGVMDVQKNVILPWYHVYRFLIQNLEQIEHQTGKQFVFDEDIIHSQQLNPLDQWIQVQCQKLVQIFCNELEAYRLYTVTPKLVLFLNDLSNWYLRLNRDRIQGVNGLEEAYISSNVLIDVLMKVNLLLAPFVPFITEMMYQNLVQVIQYGSDLHAKSIHLLRIPQPNIPIGDDDLDKVMENFKSIIEEARAIRDRNAVPLRTPVKHIAISLRDEQIAEAFQLFGLEAYIIQELNCDEMSFDLKFNQLANQTIAPLHKELGPLFKVPGNEQEIKEEKQQDKKEEKQEEKNETEKKSKQDLQQKAGLYNPSEWNQQFKKLTEKQISEFELKGELKDEHFDFPIPIKCVQFGYALNRDHGIEWITEKNSVLTSDYLIAIDLTSDDNIMKKSIAREFTFNAQNFKQKLGILPSDEVEIYYRFQNQESNVSKVILELKSFIESRTRMPLLDLPFEPIGTGTFQIRDEQFYILIAKQK